jgi:hypothetical protein
MNHFMMDLETRGNSPGCHILSIGIIAFDPFADSLDSLFADDGFYSVISRDSCTDAMLHTDADTMKWWEGQSPEARQVLAQSEATTAPPLGQVLTDTVLYVGEHCTPTNAKVWGNGADFDNPIIGVAARMLGRKLPWQWGNRCYRTMKNLHEVLGPLAKAPPVTRAGTHHNALDDAKTQAIHLWDIVHSMRRRIAA